MPRTVFPSMPSNRIYLLVIALLMFASTADAAPVLKATQLRTEYRANPLGIAEAKPRLSWLLQSADEKLRGQRQTAYQVLVASAPEKLKAGEGDLWNSDKKKSD